jgi:syntaxin 5
MKIFQRMSTIVSMQESKIERIDQDTADAEKNVKKGKKEITSIYEDVTSKRALIIKIFALIMAFSVIYVLFLL